MVSFLITSLISVVSRLDVVATELLEKYDQFDEYARVHNLPAELHKRVRQHYKADLALTRGAPEAEILDDLPRSVRLALTGHNHMQRLQELPYFRTTEFNILLKITATLKGAGHHH